jgi:hypothetical protein
VSDRFYRAEGEILYDDAANYCLMTQATFGDLREYSGTIPTGKMIGKRWKLDRAYMGQGTGWVLRGYEECDPPDPDKIAIPWWDIEVIS